MGPPLRRDSRCEPFLLMTKIDSPVIPFLFTVVDIVLSLAASGHVILNKRDTRAAIGWIGLIWLSPVLGSVLYVLLGINRINRRARTLRRGQTRPETLPARAFLPEVLDRNLMPGGSHLGAL